MLGVILLTACSQYTQKQDPAHHLKGHGDVQQDDQSALSSSTPEPDAYYFFMRGYLAKLENDPETALDNFRRVIALDPGAETVKREIVEVLYRLNMIPEAIKLAEELLRTNTEDRGLLEMLSQAYSAQNEPEKAIMVLNRLATLYPENTEAKIHLAVLYGSIGQYDNARNVINPLIDTERDAVLSAIYYIGVLAIGSGDIDKAEQLFLESIKLGYEKENVYLNLGAISDKRGQSAKAEKYFLKALSINPSSLAAMENLVQTYLNSGRETKALRMLDNMDKASPGNIDILKRRGLLLMSMKQYSKAIEVMKKAIKADPDDMQMRYYLALTYEESGDYSNAIAEYNKLIAAAPQNTKPYLNLGYLYMQMELYGEAEDIYTTLLNIAEPMAEYYIYLSKIQLLMDKYEEAENSLLKGLKKFEQNDEIHFNLAILYEEQDRFDDMIRHLRRTIALNPNHSDALNFLGYSYTEKGINLEEALSLISKSLSLKPDNGYVTDSLGWVYYKMGDYEKAVEVLKKASSIVANDSVIFEHLGDAYKAASKNHEAIRAWLRSLDVLNTEDLGKTEASELIRRVEEKIKKTRQALGH